MRFLTRMLHRKSFSVSLDKADCTFLYRERGRRLHIRGEAMADGYAVYASTIRQWDSVPVELIDDSERQRIATNIRSHFVDRGKNVYLS
jgi:hypothetical protein